MKNKWSWLIVAGGLVIVARQASSVWRLYKAGEQVHLAEAQVRREEEKNQKLKQRLAEVDNPQFIEKEAREKLGYAREGETLVILADLDRTQTQVLDAPDNRPNWRKWWDLYIRI